MPRTRTLVHFATLILLLAPSALMTGCGKDHPSQPKDPACEVTPARLDFGRVPLDSAAVRSFTISNTGGGTLTGSVADSCGRFRAASGAGSFSLASGQSRTVTVRFAPQTEDSVSCGLLLGGTVCTGVLCTGKGINGPLCDLQPGQLDFGTVAVGGSRERTFTISNGGGGLLTGTVSAECPEFSLVTGGGAYSLGRGQSHLVKVRLTPAAAGPKSCVLSLGSALCGQVPCAGTGEVPPPDLVLIPAGSFTMGSPESEPGRSDGEPQHSVTLTKPFFVSKHEVTQTEWLSLMGWNESYFLGDSLPVEGITWFDAVKFCNERSAREGRSAFYTMAVDSLEGNHIVGGRVTVNESADGYRLLTDAEWEYACRAGSATAFYSGAITHATDDCADDPALDPAGWYCQNSDYTTHLVMGKRANAFGLYDMHGNVWEWCYDWWEDSPAGPAIDPTGPSTGIQRVVRGGGWEYAPRYCRSAYRVDIEPSYQDIDLGLRVARAAQ